uniref:Uncharacterized protein n=1 Tax=Arundo donax TaxID=35708 RepID=A0A0A9EP09_ARUDO
MNKETARPIVQFVSQRGLFCPFPLNMQP